MKAKAAPSARNNGPARFAQKCPWAGTWAAHKIPVPTRIIPAAMTSLAEVRVTSIWVGAASARTDRRLLSALGGVNIREGVKDKADARKPW